MSEKDTIEYKDNGLEKLLEILEGSIDARVKVGILGSKDSRSDENSNATIGFRHEFGVGVPIRSFLRMPLINHMQKALDDAGGMSQSAIDEILLEGSLIPYLMKVGIVGEGVVQQAFNSGGYGKWKPSNMTYKKNEQTLVETQQLKNSIISQVEGE